MNEANIGATCGNILTSEMRILLDIREVFRKENWAFGGMGPSYFRFFTHYDKVFNSYQTLKLESSGNLWIYRNRLSILYILSTVFKGLTLYIEVIASAYCT